MTSSWCWLFKFCLNTSAHPCICKNGQGITYSLLADKKSTIHLNCNDFLRLQGVKINVQDSSFENSIMRIFVILMHAYFSCKDF